jgi:hypothetical protein
MTKVTFIIVAILVFSSLAQITPVTLAQPHSVQVAAHHATGPLKVLIQCQNETGSYGAETTTFNLPDQQGELTLVAPLSHIQYMSMYTFNFWSPEIDETNLPTITADKYASFYIFSYWSIQIDGTNLRATTENAITFKVTGSTIAIAHYSKIASIDKRLMDCYTQHENGTKLACDPKRLPIETFVHFNMSITFRTRIRLDGVVVKDRIAADLVLNDHQEDFGIVAYGKAAKGKMNTTIVTWTIGDISGSEKYTLDLFVQTSVNPKNQQEYTSPGMHTLNGGPEAHFILDETEYYLQGPALYVNVEDPTA